MLKKIINWIKHRKNNTHNYFISNKIKSIFIKAEYTVSRLEKVDNDINDSEYINLINSMWATLYESAIESFIITWNEMYHIHNQPVAPGGP